MQAAVLCFLDFTTRAIPLSFNCQSLPNLQQKDHWQKLHCWNNRTANFKNHKICIVTTLNCNYLIIILSWPSPAANGIRSQLHVHGPKFKFTAYKNKIFTEFHRHSHHCMLCKERSLLHDVLGTADPLLHLWVGLRCSQRRTKHPLLSNEFSCGLRSKTVPLWKGKG